jgi:hypothetical protein
MLHDHAAYRQVTGPQEFLEGTRQVYGNFLPVSGDCKLGHIRIQVLKAER